MGIKRIIDVDFWNDDKVLENFSPEDKLFMLYLLTNPHTTQLGIYAINVKHFAFELGYSVETIRVLLDRFENNYKIIKYDYATKEIAIKNYLVYSIIKGGKPVFDCLNRELKQIKSVELITYIYSNLCSKRELNKTVVEFMEVLKEKSIKKENEKQNDNDNDNDNDVSYHDTSTIRQRYVDDTSKEVKKPRKSTKFVPPTLEEIQAYCLERRNNINPKTFFDYYEAGSWADAKGNKIKNWKQKVITWEKHQQPVQNVVTQNKGSGWDYINEEFEKVRNNF